MAKYTVFESTRMGSTKCAEPIFDAVADADVENGTFGYLNGLVEGESVIYKFVPGTKDGEVVVVVDNPAWTEDESKIVNQRRDKYINEAGVPFRVRVVKRLDEFGITIEGVTPDTQKVVTDTEDFTEDVINLTINSTTGKLVAEKYVAPTSPSTTTASEPIFKARIMRKRIIGALLSTPIRNYGYSGNIYEAEVITLK